MKNKFQEFCYKPDLTRLWAECDFVFDTSVLIDLYYNKKSCNQFLEILENKISDRIWMPHQIGLEYHRNRINAIKDLDVKYINLITNIKNFTKGIDSSIKNISKSHLINLEDNVEMDLIKEKLEEMNETILSELIPSIDKDIDFFEEDMIMNKLFELYDNKIGDDYPDHILKEIYKEGDFRTKNKIPPAFEDKGQGDLILWCQIIDHVIENNRSIIFITSDAKRDWWFTTKSKKIIGPHPSLIKEFLNTGKDFYMYKLSDFLKLSKDYLDVEVSEDVIKTAKDIEDLRNTAEQLEEYEEDNKPIYKINPELLNSFRAPLLDPELLNSFRAPLLDPELLNSFSVPLFDPELLNSFRAPLIDPELLNSFRVPLIYPEKLSGDDQSGDDQSGDDQSGDDQSGE